MDTSQCNIEFMTELLCMGLGDIKCVFAMNSEALAHLERKAITLRIVCAMMDEKEALMRVK